MSDTHSTHPQLVTENGAYSVLAVSFQDDSNAYQALTVLKELDSQGRVGLQEALVVERAEDGQVIEKDRVDSTFPGSTASGGLVGLLIGIIGGPLGMLIGGSTGLVVGSLFDMADMDETDSALAQISSAVAVGHTALLAVVAEPSNEVVDTAMSKLTGTVFRRPVADVEAEIAAAEDAARKAKHEARTELMRGRRDKSRAAVKAKVDELKTKLHHGQKTPA